MGRYGGVLVGEVETTGEKTELVCVGRRPARDTPTGERLVTYPLFPRTAIWYVGVDIVYGKEIVREKVPSPKEVGR